MSGHRPLFEAHRCNCTAMRKASRRLAQIYDAALAPTGLKSTQCAILAEIDRRAAAPPTIRELADALVMDRSTLGQNLRPLERDGLICLGTDAADGRRRHVTLTGQGKARLADAHVLWRGAQALFETGFGEQAAADLRATLLGIVENPALAACEGVSA